MPETATTQRRRTGAPLKLDDDIANTIRDALRSRNVLEAAGAIAGVPRRTLYDWLRRGRTVLQALENGAKRSTFTRDELRLADFSHLVARALAEAEAQSIALIGRAGTNPSLETRTVTRSVGLDANGAPVMVTETTRIERAPDWKALAWVAERRWERWAPKQRQVIVAEDVEVAESEHEDAAAMMQDPAVLAAAEDLAAAVYEREPDRHLRAV